MMTTPEISPTRFLVLSALLDGRERNRCEICERIQWDRSRENFVLISNQLQLGGLVEKSEVTVSQAGKTFSESRFVITAAGRRAWSDTVDFYLFAAELFGKSDAAASSTQQVIDRKPARRPKVNRTPHRTMTAADREKLFRVCSLEFRRLVAAMLELDRFGIDTIGLLNIQDFDREAGELLIGGDRIPVSPEFESVITEAIGQREDGPLFARECGGRWTCEIASGRFGRLRSLAGIDPQTKLRGNSYRRG